MQQRETIQQDETAPSNRQHHHAAPAAPAPTIPSRKRSSTSDRHLDEMKSDDDATIAYRAASRVESETQHMEDERDVRAKQVRHASSVRSDNGDDEKEEDMDSLLSSTLIQQLDHAYVCLKQRCDQLQSETHEVVIAGLACLSRFSAAAASHPSVLERADALIQQLDQMSQSQQDALIQYQRDAIKREFEMSDREAHELAKKQLDAWKNTIRMRSQKLRQQQQRYDDGERILKQWLVKISPRFGDNDSASAQFSQQQQFASVANNPEPISLQDNSSTLIHAIQSCCIELKSALSATFTSTSSSSSSAVRDGGEPELKTQIEEIQSRIDEAVAVAAHGHGGRHCQSRERLKEMADTQLASLLHPDTRNDLARRVATTIQREKKCSELSAQIDAGCEVRKLMKKLQVLPQHLDLQQRRLNEMNEMLNRLMEVL